MKNLFRLNSQHVAEYIIFSIAGSVERDRLAEKIKSFGLLPKGWDFGVGNPAPPEVIKIALTLRELGSRLNLKTNAFPGTGGEIYIAFYKENDTVEIRINLDLSFNITLESGFGPDFEEADYIEEVHLDAVTDYLQKFSSSERLWRSSERYTVINMTRTVDAFQATPSKTSMEESRLLTPSVFANLRTTLVCT